MYPITAREQPTRITGPRALILSDKKVALITAMNPTVLGGTVSSWAVVTLVYPKVLIIVGRKSENEYSLYHQHFEVITKQILLLTV